MIKKKALGRGLSALIPDEIEEQFTKEGYQLEAIPIQLIKPNALQPRKTFDEEEINALSISIKRLGLLQPIIVRKLDDYYEIVAGERRWRASKLAGLETIASIVMNEDEEKLYEIALIENMQRVDLNPIEEGMAYSALIEHYHMTQQEVSQVVGKSRTHITNMMRILSLCDPVQEYVVEQKLTMGHARCLVTLTPEQQIELAKSIIKDDLSVREVEKRIKKMHSKPTTPIVSEIDPIIEDVSHKLSDWMGTKVHITTGKDKGKIEIEYYSEDDLERIVSLIIK
jgi:ParB family chromosome partitioning protein